MINFKTYSSGRSFIFVFKILDECDMWSVDGEKPKETMLFEKPYFELRLCNMKKKETSCISQLDHYAQCWLSDPIEQK